MQSQYWVVEASWNPSTSSLDRQQVYCGIDRPQFAYLGPEPTPQQVYEIYAAEQRLEQGDVEDGERAAIELWKGIEEFTKQAYTIIALDQLPSDVWHFLGYDVAERTSTRWSALAHCYTFLSLQEWQMWKQWLNPYGLFADRTRAEQFLAHYLVSDDSDMGDDTAIYDVIAVYEYQP